MLLTSGVRDTAANTRVGVAFLLADAHLVVVPECLYKLLQLKCVPSAELAD